MQVRKITAKIHLLQNIKKNTVLNKIFVFAGYLLLSWLYAACSQIIIPLPFNLVPISIQPAPLFLASFFFGWHAVNAYALYLFQGACGLPFFAGMQGGLLRLLGPTGGYLIGFGLSMAWIALCRRYVGRSSLRTILVLLIAECISFAFGLFQLSWFVPADKLLTAGLYPFLLGDFVIKIALVFFAVKAYRIAVR